MFYKKVFLEISQNSHENTYARVSFKKETLAQVFSFEFCKTCKNTFFTEHLWTTVSDLSMFEHDYIIYCPINRLSENAPTFSPQHR